MNNIWPWISHICASVNSFLSEKVGVDMGLQDKCLQSKSFVLQNMWTIIIVSGVLVGLASLTGLLRFFNQKIKKFNATLLNIKQVTYDTKIFTFDLPKGWNKINLNIGEHLTLTATINGEVVERKYTPISRSDVKRNSFELLIKVYEKGLMSSYVNNMKVGDKIQVAMPYGRFNYLGSNVVRIKQLNGKVTCTHYDHIYLVGGGTGITPLYQIIQYVSEVEAPEGKGPKITLLFANKSQRDILLKEELENYAKTNPNFRLFFSVDKAETEGWKGFTGFINEQKIKETIPENIEKCIFAACGPPPMVSLVQKLVTSKFGVKTNRFFRF